MYVLRQEKLGFQDMVYLSECSMFIFLKVHIAIDIDIDTDKI